MLARTVLARTVLARTVLARMVLARRGRERLSLQPMEGVHEVHEAQLETLATDGLELPYIEYGQVEPAVKLVWNGEDYWYHRTLPLKGYGAVMARHIRELQAEGHRPLLARFYDRIYIYATGVTPIGAGKPPGS